MSWWRKAIYLTLIAPLHNLALAFASVPFALFLPENPFVQIALITPVFAVLVWWGVPKFQRLIGLSTTNNRIASSRIPAVLGAIGLNGLAIVAVLLGYFTPVKATVACALALIAFHAWLIRQL